MGLCSPKQRIRRNSKVSLEEHADSITQFLIANKALPKNKTCTIHFVLTKFNDIFSLQVYSGDAPKKNLLQKAILQYASLWQPAIQNGHNVCVAILIKFHFQNEKLTVAREIYEQIITRFARYNLWANERMVQWLQTLEERYFFERNAL